MEEFKLGRKWWRELERPLEIGPDDSRLLQALTVNVSLGVAMINNAEGFALREVKRCTEGGHWETWLKLVVLSRIHCGLGQVTSLFWPQIPSSLK